VRLHPLALGAEHGELALNIMKHSNFSSFLAPVSSLREHYGAPSAAIARQARVRVQMLDDFFADGTTLDLLKIDVQGFERHVLAGARRTLARTRSIFIEANLVSHYQGDDTLGGIVSLLFEVGFDPWDLSAPFRAPDGRALWCDATFINRSVTPTS
jgi:hypothetical protein